MASRGQLLNYIGGEWRRSAAGEYLDVIDPATGEALARVPLSGESEVAAAALPEWRRTPPGERVQYLFKLKRLMEEHFEELARGITIENGKTLAESRGELRRGIESIETACGIPMLMQGYNLEDRRGSESILSGNPPFTIDVVLNSDRLTRPAVNLSAGFPPDTLDPSRVSLANVLLRVQDRNQRSAYVQQWNLSLQYEFLRNTLLDVGYVGNKGTKLPALRNLNQALPGPGSPAGRRTIPGFGDIQWLENRDSSNYHSMQLRIESRARDDLFVLASYTLGKAINGATENLARSGGFERNPQNSFNLRAERGPAEFDVRHNFVLAYNYALPFGRGKRFGADWHGLANSLLGNWQINGIASIRSGFAMNVTIASGLVPNLEGERAPRPDLVANPALPESQRTIQRWFNTAAFAVPSGTFGNAGRGILYGPEAVNFDFSVFKNFIVAERMTVQFRTEFFNLFNHPNFDPPDAVMGAAGFGAISSAQPSRQIQFALKLLF